ncbi:MAG: PaaI family thioesterase [Steroidobacteraceae bacterium]
MNSDRDLVLELTQGGRLPAPLASNPLARELEAEVLEVSPDGGAAVLAFDPPARFAHGGGVLQGGIVTALLDFAMAFAAHAQLATDQRAFATASMNIHFLRPAPPARYIARGRIVRAGRKLLFAEAQLFSAGPSGPAATSEPGAAAGRESASDGELIAAASAVLSLAER